ncbi:MAG TPA: hypothetical protein VE996_15205 [Terriglobales bacterium]|nr:hypothetical protein [Terriglobales bacterium]
MNRKTFVRAALAFMLLAAFAWAADLSGTWNGSSNSNQNGQRDFTMTFKQVNGALAGTLSVADGGDMPMEYLKFDGKNISFQVETEGGVYTIKGTVSGDKMSGTFSSDQNDTGTWTAERAKAAAGGAAGIR